MVSVRFNAIGFLIVVMLFTVLSHLNWSSVSLHENKKLMSGERFAAIEKDYDQAFSARTFAISLWAALDYVLFSTGRAGVEVGQSGWLFSSEEYDNTPFSAPEVQNNLEAIETAKLAIEEKGGMLFVVPLPSKARIYDQYLVDPLPSHARKRLANFESWLSTAQIDALFDVVELADALPEQEAFFLQQDTHWTAAGARIFAESVIENVRELNPRLPWGSVSFETQKVMSEAGFRGDLLNYLPLAPYFDFLLPEQPLPAGYQTGRREPPGLFDELQYSLALVGTSYSAKSEWNFVGFLQQSAGLDVLDFSQEGQGPFLPMTAFLASEQFQAESPLVVIWEVPERYLAVSVQ